LIRPPKINSDKAQTRLGSYKGKRKSRKEIK
jgi:hypothetical protein